jgi:hypothetical protein
VATKTRVGAVATGYVVEYLPDAHDDGSGEKPHRELGKRALRINQLNKRRVVGTQEAAALSQIIHESGSTGSLLER